MSRRSPGRPASGTRAQSGHAPPQRDADLVLSPRRRFVFHLVTLLLPFALLGIGEIACRARGWGGYPAVLQRIGNDAGTTWYATSRRATNRYFRGGSLTGGMRELQFVSPKRSGSVRIVFLGESAIQGFPQPLPVTNGAFLAAMLRDAWQGTREVEVLNLGATAVASFPVGYFLEAALQHQPDLVVLMMGSNEYYGAYGVASLRGPARSPAGMRLLRGLRGSGVLQWTESWLGRRAPPTRTLMEQLAGKQVIAADNKLRRAAATSLQTHLEAMVARCVAARVPVIVCTVPTNERGLAPIGTAAPDSTGARAHFLLGSALTRAGRHPEAAAEYVLGRDLDVRPWRATSTANAIARAMAAKGATVCDMEAAFRDASPGGAIGWELLDDHVHMSLCGQALFARTIAATLASMPEPLHVDPTTLAALPDWETVAARLGHSVFTDYVAASHMRSLFEIGFMQQSNPEAFRRFDARRDTLLAQMSEVDRAAVERRRDPSLHGATDRPLEFVAGVYRMGAGDFETAAQLFRVARASLATVSLWRLECTWHLLGCNRRLHETPTQEDVALCAEAVRIGELLERFGDAKNPAEQRFLGLAYNLAGKHAAAVERLEPAAQAFDGADGWEVVAALADSYLQLGRVEDARRVLRQAAARPDMAAPARGMLQRLEGRVSSPGG